MIFDSSSFFLKDEFCAELNLPRIESGSEVAECGRSEDRSNSGEIRMIEDIEELAAELDPRAFRKRNLPKNGEVQIRAVRTA